MALPIMAAPVKPAAKPMSKPAAKPAGAPAGMEAAKFVLPKVYYLGTPPIVKDTNAEEPRSWLSNADIASGKIAMLSEVALHGPVCKKC